MKPSNGAAPAPPAAHQEQAPNGHVEQKAAKQAAKQAAVNRQKKQKAKIASSVLSPSSTAGALLQQASFLIVFIALGYGLYLFLSEEAEESVARGGRKLSSSSKSKKNKNDDDSQDSRFDHQAGIHQTKSKKNRPKKYKEHGFLFVDDSPDPKVAAFTSWLLEDCEAMGFDALFLSQNFERKFEVDPML